MIEAEADLTVVGEADTAEIAYGRIPATNPDVAVLDVRLPDGDGVEVCREIRSKHPGIACLMLTSFADDEALFAAIMAGAAGFVLKQVRGTDLIDGIRRVSKPGRRVYVNTKDVPTVRRGLGVAVMSTSKGILSDKDAREQKVGGEVVCEVW